MYLFPRLVYSQKEGGLDLPALLKQYLTQHRDKLLCGQTNDYLFLVRTSEVKLTRYE